MTENLRLDPTGKVLDSTNTNNPSAEFASAVAELSAPVQVTNCSELDYSDRGPCSRQVSYSLGNMTGTNPSPTIRSIYYNVQWYSYGAEYNYFTATAGNGSYLKTDDPTRGDLCPAGWNLPDTEKKSEYDEEFYSAAEYAKLNLALGNPAWTSSQFAPAEPWLAFPVNITLSVNGRYGWYWLIGPHGSLQGIKGFDVDRTDNTAVDRFIQFIYEHRPMRCLVSQYYNVHYEPNTPSSVTSEGATPDQRVRIGQILTLQRNGFTVPDVLVFDGWNTKADGTGTDYSEEQSTSFPLADEGGTATLYAKWKPAIIADYTIKVNSNTDPATENQYTAYYGSKIEIPRFIGEQRPGYRISSFNTEPDGSGADFSTLRKQFEDEDDTEYEEHAEIEIELNLNTIIDTKAIENNLTITLYAIWERAPYEEYDIRFEANGGSGYMEELYSIPYGSTVGPFTSEFEGEYDYPRSYVFAYWSTDPDGEGLNFSDTDPIEINKELVAYAEDQDSYGIITLYAIWKLGPFETYDIEFDNDGYGEEINPQYGVPFGSSVGPFTLEAGEGSMMRFVGWNTEQDGSGFSIGPTEQITVNDELVAYAEDYGSYGRILLYAIWEPEEAP